MSVYCIYLGEDVYYGSTKLDLIGRENRHNFRLKEGISKTKLYEKARELGIEELQLVSLYEGDDYLDVEHDLICSNENCLNMCGAKYDRERSLKLHRETQKRYYYRRKAKLLSQKNI